MKRTILALNAVLLVVCGLAVAAEAATPPPPPRIEIGSVRVVEARGKQLTLDMTWSYIEQDNMARQRPSEFNIIAILIGLRSEPFTVKLTVPVPAKGPIPLTARVVVNHEEQIVSPRDFKANLTVEGKIQITDGTSNVVVGRKEAALRVEP